MINGLVSHGSKVYSYDLTYEGLHSYTNLLGLPHLGVCHGDELIYLWHPISQLGLVLTGEMTDTSHLQFFYFSEEDILVKDLLTEAWTNFAKYGDPTPPGSEYHWAPVDQKIGETDQWYFNISGHHTSGMDASPEVFRRLAFWDTLLLKFDLS